MNPGSEFQNRIQQDIDCELHYLFSNTSQAHSTIKHSTQELRVSDNLANVP